MHRDGILRLTRAPYGNAALTRQAQRAARKLLDAFQVRRRAHHRVLRRSAAGSSPTKWRRACTTPGHWTIEGADTSQFENHVRAIAGLPLGSTQPRGHSAMINLVGEMPTRDALLAEPGLHWHDYGKTARPGRKLGHVTICESAAQSRDRRAFKLLSRIDRATWLALR